ncbi:MULTISPECIES: lipocalin family protein [unclassified Massilia]|uniref:lipocalin family protein n=1 Tax=unclassified Massilia TaxID=2609279 RepID=UPI001B81548A|nr:MULTISPECIES: lipocalin family protein [unclassified Massilia]MBQ5940428.1 lipocalin family protein [Massilia sp. AB1]MBQ5965958.1 lipocalin family protein [Massilia sp. ZL223]
MKRVLLSSALCALGLHAGAAPAAEALATIPALDVQRYMGAWYEIAKFPNDFQKKCVGDTTATYSLREDGRVKVVNRCRTRDGGAEVAEGVARQVGSATSPRLEVRFAPAILSFLPMVWGDYWVIDLDQDYRLSAVSEPKREYLWILSRTPQVDAAAYEALLARLRAQGLDTSRLVRTIHGNNPGTLAPAQLR